MGKQISATSKSLKETEDYNLRVIDMFANILEDLICIDPLESEQSKFSMRNVSVFDCKKPPKMSIKDYLTRIVKYSELEASTLIASLIFMDSFTQAQIPLTKFNVHRLLITSVVVAIKMNEDVIYKNEFYASIGGIKLELLNSMESVFIELLNFRLHIEKETFESYQKLVESAKIENKNT